ncbi:guanine nucleotide-binding protein subunit gamma 4-like [Phragmites australis]|uniref:guanine nucleotide-binding protein subunit gamma 4-like n=1 Tax=Phragmites australis TaxID=29695 RepID=UPI002D76E6ED|nr:guanine nucleotide-binding protein subunit gamma 4-like [Phragmites australis]
MAAAAPRPKSPPASPDPSGRHRLQLAVDALHREIRFLEGEISSTEGVHAASRCCKEVDEFVVGRNPDPFITIRPEKGRKDQSQQFLKKLRVKTCLSYLSWICCCGGCSPFQLKRPPTSCSCAAQLRRLCCSCCCCSCCRCRVVYAGCCAPCPRCSCDCTCTCPRCSDACCAPRCCLCL